MSISKKYNDNISVPVKIALSEYELDRDTELMAEPELEDDYPAERPLRFDPPTR